MPTTSRSWTTTDARRPQRGRNKPQLLERRLPRNLPPTSPGEMLLEEFLKPLGISQSAFAVRLGVSFPRLNEIIRGKRSVTPDTALRLARVLGMSADFWLGLQQDWDLWHAMRGEGAAAIAALEPLEPTARRPR
jgi:antitoxin HigA-1